MKFKYNDGGRQAAGFMGKVGDCVCRAITIATGGNYREVYDDMNEFARQNESLSRKNRKAGGPSSARNGYHHTTARAYLQSKGWTWHPTMHIGSGCKVHLTDGEVPMKGPVVCQVSKHWTSVIDGVVNDTYDCTREGNRCVYGYFTPPHSMQQ